MAEPLPKVYAPKEVEERWLRISGSSASSSTPSRTRGRRLLHHRHPAAQRHRRPAHGPRAQQHLPGHPHPLAPHAGLQHALGARHRPRRHRHAERGRAATLADEGNSPPATSGARSSSSASGSGRSNTAARIIQQLKRMGCSCDWDRQRFTMDEGLSRAVRETFVRLYEEGLIYRGKYIVNWCPRCRTALSDDEVEHEERRGQPLAHPLPLERRQPASSPSPPPGRRRCSATPPWPSTPTTSATVTSSAGRSSLPLVGREIPDHRRRARSTRPSAPAP